MVLLALLSFLAVAPGLGGEGTSIPHMQLVGLIAGTMVAAVGLNLVSGFAGLISLGQGAMYAIGAYVFGYLSLKGDLPFLLAVPVTLVACAVLGVFVALGTARLRGPQFTMITLVLAVLVHKVLVEWPVLGAASGYPNVLQHETGLLPDVSIFGFTFVPPLFGGEFASVLLLVLGLTLIALVLYRNLSLSSWGRSLRAVGESELLASHLGVFVFRRKVAALGIASALGGLGGIFYALLFAHLQPESFDVFFSITILLAVILGGSGTVLGPAVGAVIVVWLERSDALEGVTEFQRRTFSEQWYLSTPGIIGLILIVSLFVLPRGVVGTLSDQVAKRTRRERGQAAATGKPSASPSMTEFLTVETDDSADAEAILAITGAAKQFGGLRAVDNVDLRVRRGSIHGVIGPNGAGKSSLANVVSGAYRPDGGAILLAGEDISGLRPDQITHRGLARTFQTPQLFGSATVLENVKAGFADTGRLSWWKAALKPRSQYRREAELEELSAALLRRVGLSEEAHVLAEGLAYGKARALEIARALASQPKVLILDEPAAGLNATEVTELGRLLSELRADGLGLILVEHHMDLISTVADEVTCMAQGAVIAHGSASEVLTDETVRAVYLGTSGVSSQPETTYEGRPV
ncbi:branched-chain amino acid ABC transporter ATP-binding protein/permease [Nocardioides sp. QY071]|uniref:branched-chain amino acid ABC transporter ATP-binding protein/permease n=1 Tax=Nocardioides sp. QY071 TaxID=3044187 RepID=UPI002499C941|nr:branched-chain amino acid ABC transporter ATP-binding protein/permease [Nocardioides sp. QY071]WGY00447.1 branched-chain amino acid ABC transporter ATP-binding protein/permease [Nocardioides sp. QY071]